MVQSFKVHNWGPEYNLLFQLREIPATSVKPQFHLCVSGSSLCRWTFWRSAKAFWCSTLRVPEVKSILGAENSGVDILPTIPNLSLTYWNTWGESMSSYLWFVWMKGLILYGQPTWYLSFHAVHQKYQAPFHQSGCHRCQHFLTESREVQRQINTIHILF